MKQIASNYPSAQTTLIILLGVSTWLDEPEQEGLVCAAEKVEKYFRQTYGVSDAHFRSYFNDPQPATKIMGDIHSWLETVENEAKDLIIYYIGHGKHTLKHRELYLAIKDTQAFDPEGTSLRIASLVNATKPVRLRRYFILDCCFAAAAIPDLQGTSEGDLLRNILEDAEVQIKGWTALFSSGKGKASVILPNKTNTYFSAALLQALHTLPSSDAPFSFAYVWPEINRQRNSLRLRYRHHPYTKEDPPSAELASGDLANMPIFFSLKQAPLLMAQQPQLEVKDIKLVTRLIDHKNGITAIALSPDDQILVFGDKKGKIKILDIMKKSFLAPRTGSLYGLFILNSVTSIVFHPEGRTFYVGWKDGKSKLWSSSGAFIASWSYSHKREITDLAISPDGLVLISAGEAQKEEVKDVDSRGSLLFLSPRHSLRKINYPKTDKQIDDTKYRYLDLFDYYNCSVVTNSIAFSPRGHFFAASDSTGKIQIWDICQGKERLPLKNQTNSQDMFTNVTFHSEENLIAAINKEGQCFIWNAMTTEIQKVLNPRSENITALAFSPDGYSLATAHSNGVISFWNPFSGELLHFFHAHKQSISALIYSHDGYNLISGCLDGTIKLWGTEN